MISVEKITTADQFAALHDDWNQLLQRSKSDCVFLTHEWLSTWWKHLAEGRKLHIVTAREGSRLIGILPLSLRPSQVARMMPRTLEFLGSGIIGSDYLDVIIEDGRANDVLDAFAHHIASSGFMVQFGQLRRADCAVSELAATLSHRDWAASDQKINVCPFISLEGHSWTTYLATLSSNQRYNFQRRLRNLEKTEGFRVEKRTSLEVVIELHKKRWSDRSGQSEAFQSETIVAFHREFVRLAEERGWLRLLSLWIRDRPVAALYGLRYGRTFYFYQSGFDPAFARQSVGLVVMGQAIKTALEEGASEYDLLHGSEEYKFHWTQSTRELGRIELFPPRARGAFYKHCVTLNRAARQLVRRMLAKTA